MPCCAVSKTLKSVVAAGSVTRAASTSLVHVYRNNYDWWVYTPMLFLCGESMHARLLISRYVIAMHILFHDIRACLVFASWRHFYTFRTVLRVRADTLNLFLILLVSVGSRDTVEWYLYDTAVFCWIKNATLCG